MLNARGSTVAGIEGNKRWALLCSSTCRPHVATIPGAPHQTLLEAKLEVAGTHWSLEVGPDTLTVVMRVVVIVVLLVGYYQKHTPELVHQDMDYCWSIGSRCALSSTSKH